MEINLAFPAINRPTLVEKTLISICKHLKGVDFEKSTIFVNVDPVPIIYGREKVIEICKKYFGNIVFNMPNKPHISVAFKWLLKNASQKNDNIIFFCNDDWEFIKDIEINKVIKRLSKYNNINQISINNDWTHMKKKKNKYKEDQFDMYHGTPSFFDNKFIKDVIDDLDEYDIGHGGGAEIIEPQMTDKYGKGSIWYSNKNIYYCKDLGLEWKKNYGIPGPMLYECQKYKLCIYCGSLEYKYKCSICDKSVQAVLCNKDCFKKHCMLFHNENEKPEMIECKNSYHERFYKNK